MASRLLSREDVRLFLAKAASGSVGQAARSLHLGRATVSRRPAGMAHSLNKPRGRRRMQGRDVTGSGQRQPSAMSSRA